MENKKYDYLVVGSGAGGATLAKELAKRKKNVLLVEAGKIEKSVGTFRDAHKFYDANRLVPLPKRSREGTIIWRAFMAGGSTVVSCGNGVRCLEKELNEFGINITEELNQAEQETHTAPISERLLSNGSKNIREAAKALGYNMQLMPKFIDPKLCRKCGNCSFGCSQNAKWTALNYLEEAEQNGCETVFSTRAARVIIENGKAKGIETVSKQGRKEIPANAVILAAGGIGTPVILQNSGINDAGKTLFLDLLVNVYGVTDDEKLNQVFEPMMALVNLDFHDSKGFLLSPSVNHHRLIKYIELGMSGLTMPDKRTLGMMVKISDEPAGCVYPDGSVSKPVTEKDRQKLKEGAEVAKEILLKTGARSIKVSKVQGAHPGGTAAIGKVVDKDLQTRVEGLFVCDASVLPVTPGLPPILTIVALAKRLAKNLP